MKIQKLAILAVMVVVFGAPGALPAQPGTQPYVFYGEGPWGGAYLGVDTRDVTSDRVSALRLKEESGVEVTMVDQDAPAGKAGLKEHDVILTVNSQPVQSVEQLRRMIHEIPAGRTVSLGISRDGQPMNVTAQLAERDKTPGPDHAFNFNMPAIHIPPINLPDMELTGPIVVMHGISRSGLMIESLTPQLGDYFGVKNGNGVLIRSVERGSKAEQAGFHAGDVIVKVNGSAVNDCTDFTRLLRTRTEGKASITVVRDRKEQNLTLTLPEPRRSGSIGQRKCEDLDEEACAEVIEESNEVAAMVPEIMTAEIKRIQPEMERAKKQIQEEILNHRDELKKEMDNLQQELREQQEELKQEMKQWVREADI